MKFKLCILCAIFFNSFLIAQQEIEFLGNVGAPHLDLIQTSTTDQYSRIWFQNTMPSPGLWSIRAGIDGDGESDMDFRFSNGSIVKSLFQIDGDDDEAYFNTNLNVDGKGIFHRTDGLTQYLDLITSGTNADAIMRIGSDGAKNAQIGWDPGDNALKLIPSGSGFTNSGLIIKKFNTSDIRYGFNTAPQEADRISVQYDPADISEAHLNLIATGSADYSRLKFSNSSSLNPHQFVLAGGVQDTKPRLHFSYSDDDGVSGIRIMTIRGPEKQVLVNGDLKVTDSLLIDGELVIDDIVRIGTGLQLSPSSTYKGGLINVRDSVGNNKIRLFATPGATDKGGFISMFNNDNERTILLQANDTQNAGRIKLSQADGTEKLIMDANWSGTGNARVVTDELELNGGSDFAEHFDVVGDEILPGTVVSISVMNPGQLELSRTPYDHKVAGIVSGANGINPGVLMGQSGSIADGEIPVALSGRVYVHTNIEGGEIVPGDLITTSSSPGIAMKASDRGKAYGSIIGKAMTHADENGFVLVLVNLQ